MFHATNFFLFAIALCVSSSYGTDDANTSKSVENQRKGRLLGINGYLTGNSDSFRGGPFWKQWNAVLQLNVQKRKDPRGDFIVLPASLFYGNYHSPNSFAFAGSGYYPNGFGNGPLNTQFDDAKPLDDEKPSLALASATTNPPSSKLRSKLNTERGDNESEYFINESETNEVKDEIDRKTHKRDIHKQRWSGNRDDREVPADVMEITKPLPIDESTENVTFAETTSESQTSTESTTTIQPETTTNDEPTEKLETSTEFSPPDFEFKPIYTLYYGGQPNDIADHIYLTTSDAEQSTESMPLASTTSPKLIHNSIENRNEFKPSVQYEYKNYRFDIDEHFVPIVGSPQIF